MRGSSIRGPVAISSADRYCESMTEEGDERDDSDRLSFEGQHAFKGATSMDLPTDSRESPSDEQEGLTLEGQHAFKGSLGWYLSRKRQQ